MSRKAIFTFLMPLIGVIYLLSSSPFPTQAHAEYERSDPPADAVIAEPPAEVQVWFSQELFRREGANSLQVFGPGGAQVDQGDSRIDDDDRRLMLVSLPTELADGRYTVKWRNLSIEDGHEGEGEFSFSIDSDAGAGGETPATQPVAPASNPTPAPAPGPTPQPQTQLPCFGGLIFGALLVGLVWPGRKQSDA
jgi:methionine-rich copper-binding protein CopC